MFFLKTFFLLVFLSSVCIAQLPYEQLWTSVLEQHLVDGKKKGIHSNLIDYNKLLESQTFISIVRYFNEFDLNTLESNEDRFAFWLNVYNVSVVKIVLENYPLASIKDAGTLISPIWTQPLVSVGGILFSLKDIEDNFLKPLKDSRYHFALFKGTLSGANLRNEAYSASTLNTQLNDQLFNFFKNKSKGIKLNKGTKDLEVSRIFKWETSSFDADGGVMVFIQKHSDIDYSRYSLSFLNYNWMLNKK